MIFMADAAAAKPEKKARSAKPYKQGAKYCPKCGSRMADHKDRYACGRCTYTEWKSNK